MLKILQQKLHQMNGQRNLHCPGYGCVRLQMLPSSVAFGFPRLFFAMLLRWNLRSVSADCQGKEGGCSDLILTC